MSLQVFFLTCLCFSDIFAVFSNILGFYRIFSSVHIAGNVASVTLSFSSFFCMAYSAGGVYEKDQKLRKTIKEISFSLRCSEGTKRDGKLLLEFIRSREKLIFTGNGVFAFTKSFLLSSAGVLISYNLLLLQLETK
ncbi:hypothetical protein AVEN_265419-1 [Araneus ventricosus]|uniref:Uncharacterized protein n=1 Tax=Araneus ventricosus TaxID=182803 RepID=A0A4Y2THS9_ARAVE|nr:hypothetical protein AVEN_265419-1 [Araneus ventricosus]